MDASSIRAGLVRLGFALGRVRPIAKHVVLATSHADHLSGNLAVIRERMRGHNTMTSRGLTASGRGLPLVVLTQRQAGGALVLLSAALGSIVAGYHLATAALFVVDDYFFPMYVVRPRPGTRFVQVWHACGALKKFGYSTLDKDFGRDEAFARRFPIHSNYDLCLVSSMAVAPFYAEAFGQPLERFDSRIGIPRTDVLCDRELGTQVADRVRSTYGLASGKRVILYAPTFRGERTTAATQPTDLDLRTLRATLGDDHVVLVRAHPFVRDRLALGPDVASFAIDVSGHPDINELMLVSDVLVTDYSSALFEFALLDRPICLFAPDLAAYEAERGLYIDYREALPGPVFETTDALADHLRRGEFDMAAVRRVRDWAFDVADGQATHRFLREVVLPAIT
jgi:teichoic acid ribitol-phosphate primase